MRFPRQAIACRKIQGTGGFPVLRSRNGNSHHCVCRTVGTDTSVPTMPWVSIRATSMYTPEKYLSIKLRIKSRKGPGQVSSLLVCRIRAVEKEDTTPLSGQYLWDLRTLSLPVSHHLPR